MNNKTTEVKVWKVIIGEKLNVEKVESVLKEVSEIVQETGHESILEVERIDVKEDETVVFISGKGPAVDTFMKTLRVHSPKARSEVLEAKVDDLIDCHSLR